MARTGWVAGELDPRSSCTSVVDMIAFPGKPIRIIKPYLNATGLPALSLMSPQAFSMAAITGFGMGT